MTHYKSELSTVGIEQKFSSRELLLSPNQETTSVFYLKSGVVRAFMLDFDGEVITIGYFFPGSTFPTLALFETPYYSEYFFEARTKVTVQKIESKIFMSFAEKKDFSKALIERLSYGIKGLSFRILLLSKTAQVRILLALYYLGKHFSKLGSENYHFTHQEVAELSGVTRETVSRVLSSLAKQDIITITDHHIDKINAERIEDLPILKHIGFNNK